MSKRTMLALGLTLAFAVHAVAQGPEVVARSRRLAENNQLGILEYCRAQGAIGDDVVALQQAAVARLPGQSGSDADEARSAGRAGVVAFETSRVPIADAAMGEGMPIASRCKHIAMSVQAQAGVAPTW